MEGGLSSRIRFSGIVVFPTLGNAHDRRGRDWRAGGPLSYANFRASYWRPALRRLGLPYVTPHSARHAFISTLQAQGIEVGLVAKLAGHANATVTLAHYTQAVRGGEVAVEALERAYGARVQASGCDPTGNPGDVWSPKADPDELLRQTAPKGIGGLLKSASSVALFAALWFVRDEWLRPRKRLTWAAIAAPTLKSG